MAFCRYCGRKLEEGEVCDCRSQSGGTNQSSDSVQNAGMGRSTAQKRRSDFEDEDDFISLKIDREKMNQAKKKLKSAGSAAAGMAGQAASRASQAAERANQAAAESRKRPGGAFERHMPIVDKCIAAGQGEIPVRQYDIAMLRTVIPYKKAEGRLQVTNRRVIFRATGKSSMGPIFMENEFDISEISGIEITEGRSVSGWSVFLGILCELAFGGVGSALSMAFYSMAQFLLVFFAIAAAAGGIAMACMVKKFLWVKMGLFEVAAIAFILNYSLSGSYNIYTGYERGSIFWMVLGIACMVAAAVFFIMFVIRGDLLIMIKSKEAGVVMQVRRQMFLHPNSGFKEVFEWKDTEAATRELGALISDIRTYGDEGALRWIKK